MRRAYKIGFATLIGAALLSSCIRDNGDPYCPAPPPEPEVSTLKLTLASRNMDIPLTQADLKIAVAYVFDSTGKLFGTWAKQNPALDTPSDTGIVLGNDTYRLVTWINPEAPYSITPAYTPATVRQATRSDLTDGRVTLNVRQDRDVTEPIPMLLYGSVERLRASSEGSASDVALTFNTYRITVTLKGIQQDGSTYRLQIADTNGAYDFNNNFIETPGFNYVASATAGSAGGTGDLVLSLNTMKLDYSRAPMISVVNRTTGRTVFPQNGHPSVNMMNLLGLAGINIGNTHSIHLEVPAPPVTPPPDGAHSPVEVYVNGWHVVVDDGYIIHPS